MPPGQSRAGPLERRRIHRCQPFVAGTGEGGVLVQRAPRLVALSRYIAPSAADSASSGVAEVVKAATPTLARTSNGLDRTVTVVLAARRSRPFHAPSAAVFRRHQPDPPPPTASRTPPSKAENRRRPDPGLRRGQRRYSVVDMVLVAVVPRRGMRFGLVCQDCVTSAQQVSMPGIMSHGRRSATGACSRVCRDRRQAQAVRHDGNERDALGTRWMAQWVQIERLPPRVSRVRHPTDQVVSRV